MKTTILLQPEIYRQLADEAKLEYGSIRKMSVVLNGILARYFVRKKDMFGSTAGPLDYSGYRDKEDRF